MSHSGTTYVNPNKRFEYDDDDTFDDRFRTRIPPTQPSKPAPSGYGSHIAAFEQEQQRQAMSERQREIEQRTLDSSSRSIDLLRECEQFGIANAEELSRQREPLENTNKRLDEIKTNLKYSQKHLNGIKSVFHGLKNYISGKCDPIPRSQSSPNMQSAGSSSRLDTIDNLSQMNSDAHFRSHPATSLRELDAQAQAAPISDSQRVNQVLDANYDKMLHSITRLKCLGNALGEEIVQQTSLINEIQEKIEVADIKMGKQNKSMNKILGK